MCTVQEPSVHAGLCKSDSDAVPLANFRQSRSLRSCCLFRPGPNTGATSSRGADQRHGLLQERRHSIPDGVPPGHDHYRGWGAALPHVLRHTWALVVDEMRAPEDKIAVLDRQPTLSRSRTRRRRGSYRTLTRPPGADGCKHGLDARLAEGKDSQPARH